MTMPKLRTEIRAAVGDKISERLVKLEVSLANITETLSWHIAAGDASLKDIVEKLDTLNKSLNILFLKNATDAGERAALERMARTAGALTGGILAGAISLGIALIEHLTR
jgi:hypothetical protein